MGYLVRNFGSNLDLEEAKKNYLLSDKIVASRVKERLKLTEALDKSKSMNSKLDEILSTVQKEKVSKLNHFIAFLKDTVYLCLAFMIVLGAVITAFFVNLNLSLN